MADIFDEVNEDLRAERAQRLFRRYGFLLVIAAVLVVVGVSGSQYWSWRSWRTRSAVASSFIAAAQQADLPLGTPPAQRIEAAEALSAMAKDGPSGYRALAMLRNAALKASGGDLTGALALWDQVSADDSTDQDLRRIATLLWVQHQVDTVEPATVESRLAPLLAPGTAWQPMAMESQAWLKLRTGDKSGAVTVLKQILAAAAIPPGVRARVTGLLTELGERADEVAALEKQG